MLKDINGRDTVEKIYIYVIEKLKYCGCFAKPYLRRIVRFFALPYCYVFLVNWERCPKSYKDVFIDFVYIFFVLKYYPDNYSPCEFWNYPRDQWKFFYGSNYEPFQRARLRIDVQKKKYEVLYEDKWVCGELCNAKDIPTPETLGVIHSGPSAASDSLNIIKSRKKSGRYLIKPIDGKGGHSIKILYVSESGDVTLIHPDGQVFSKDLITTTHIIQECVPQHSALTEFSSATNTTRLVSMIKMDGSVLIQGAYIRFGAANKMLDNLSQGGLAVPIDLATGKLGNRGLDRHGVPYTKHPGSGKKFEGFVMPHWKELLALGRKVQKSLPFQKLLGMDIAVGPEGPVIIEINSIYDNVDFEQMCGPILKKEEILREYGKYGLLISRKQKDLFKEFVDEWECQ